MQHVGNHNLIFRQDVVFLLAEMVHLQRQQHGEHTQRRDAADGKVDFRRDVVEEAGERRGGGPAQRRPHTDAAKLHIVQAAEAVDIGLFRRDAGIPAEAKEQRADDHPADKVALQQRQVDPDIEGGHQRRDNTDKIEQVLLHADFIHDVAVHRLNHHGEYAIHRKHGANIDSVQPGFVAKPDGVQAEACRPGEGKEENKET